MPNQKLRNIIVVEEGKYPTPNPLHHPVSPNWGKLRRTCEVHSPRTQAG